MSGNRARDISPSDSKATRRTAFIVISLSSRKNVASGVVIIESKQAADLSQEIVWIVRIAACGTRPRRSSCWQAAMEPRSCITQPCGALLHPLGARGRKTAIRGRPGGIVLLRKRRVPHCSPPPCCSRGVVGVLDVAPDHGNNGAATFFCSLHRHATEG